MGQHKKWVVANCKMNDELRNYVNVRKIYLCLPYELKDEAKENKARWDTTRKKWYFFSCQQIPELFQDYIIDDDDGDDY